MRYIQGIKNFFKGKKNIYDILNIPTKYFSDDMWNPKNSRGDVHRSRYCVYKDAEILPNTNSISKYQSGRHWEIFDYDLWKEENPGSILLLGVECFNKPNLHLICPKVFFNDLIEICTKDNLEIFFVEFLELGDKTTVAQVRVKEKDFIKSDGLPPDVRDHYLNNIKQEFNKKQKYFIENYTMKFRYVSSSIYSVEKSDVTRDRPGYIDDPNGFMRFSVEIGL